MKIGEVYKRSVKMEKLSMCRVCLEEDIRLHSIETHLQEIYECLVLAPFETKDSRPILVCYICCARLQNCYELRRSCLRSEKLFTQMLNCEELASVELQEIDNEKRLSIVHNVVHLSMGHELQMSADNVGVEALMFDDVKVEQNDPEDINEDAQEENSVNDNRQSADSDDDPLIIEKEEQSEDKTSDHTRKEFERVVQRNPENVTSSNLRERELVQDMFKELHKVTAADKTEAKSANEVTFTLNDNNKERSTSVPHSKRVQYTCDTCQRCYSSKCKLERHIRLCSDVWKKDLSRENSTSSHTHTGQRPHQCHVCGKSYQCMSYLTRHIHTHPGEKLYQCNVCKKSFLATSDFTRHICTPTGEKSKPLECHVCKKKFSFKSHLIDHIHTHPGEKPYQCNKCEKRFSLKLILSNHMKSKKCCPKFSNLITHMHAYTGRKFRQCDLCHKQFAQTSHLTSHMRSHTGEKPYQCTVCKKYFSQIGTLNVHMRTHTGEKPYRCSICKKYFSQPNHLVRHMRTHTGEKPYQCNVCNKCFLQDCNLNTHMRTHNKR